MVLKHYINRQLQLQSLRFPPKYCKIGQFLQSKSNNNCMQKLKYSKEIHQQHFLKSSSRKFKQRKAIERIQTNSSTTRGYQDQGISHSFDYDFQAFSQQSGQGHMPNPSSHDNLATSSLLMWKSSLEKQSLADFFKKLKFIAFIQKQSKQNKQIIGCKEKIVQKLRLQVTQKQDQLKAQNLRYAKKEQRFKDLKLRMMKDREMLNRGIATQLKGLNLQIKKMKTKQKHQRLKTQLPLNTNNQANIQSYHKAIPFYYPIPIYWQYPNYYPQQARYSNTHHVANLQNYNQYQPLARTPLSNQQIYYSQQRKMRYQDTQESKPSQQPISDSHRRRLLSGNGTPPRTSKNFERKSSQIRKSKQSFKQGDSSKYKKKNPQSPSQNQTNLQPKVVNLRYFNTESQSQNESHYNFIALNLQKQSTKNKKTAKIQNNSESQSNTHQKNEQSQSQYWFQLMQHSRQSRKKAAITKNLRSDFLNVFEQKSLKESQVGSNPSNVNLTISSEQQKKKKKKQSSSEQSMKPSAKTPILQSAIDISLSGLSQSKISKRSRANHSDEQAEKQVNRYLPYLPKQFKQIQEENQDFNSLVATPNSFATPRNNSQNQKSATPTNSQKQKKISIIQQAEEHPTPLKSPQPLRTAQNRQQLQKQSSNKMEERSQTNNLNRLRTIGKRQQDDDILSQIQLVGQSKISRLKSQYRKSLASQINDNEDISSGKANAQFIRLMSQQDSSFDDINFVLNGQSNVVKKVKQNSNLRSLESSPSKGSQQDQKSNRTASFYLELYQPTIQEKEEYQEDSPSNLEKEEKSKLRK